MISALITQLIKTKLYKILKTTKIKKNHKPKIIRNKIKNKMFFINHADKEMFRKLISKLDCNYKPTIVGKNNIIGVGEFKKLIKSHNFNTRKNFILRKFTEKINKIYFLHSNNSLLYYTNNQIIINRCGLNTPKKLYFKILQSASAIKKVKMIIISQLLFSIKLLFLYPTFSLKNNKIINNGVTLNNLLRDKYLWFNMYLEGGNNFNLFTPTSKAYLYKLNFQIYSINKSPMAQKKRRGKEQYYSSYYMHNIKLKFYKMPKYYSSYHGFLENLKNYNWRVGEELTSIITTPHHMNNVVSGVQKTNNMFFTKCGISSTPWFLSKHFKFTHVLKYKPAFNFL